MSKTVSIRKGLDIRLEGEAAKNISSLPLSPTICISPLDFHGLNPKLVVKEGDAVKAGDAIFFDKANESVMYCTTASGIVKAIVRGEKRRILQVLIETGAEQVYRQSDPINVASASADEVKAKMLANGLWSLVKQRPLDVVADPNQNPKAIFVTAFDSSPLAPDFNFVLEGREKDLQAGLLALTKLTSGKVHFNINPNQSSALSGVSGVEINKFSGKHPAGNVGTQIHHIDPVNKGEFVWTLNAIDVAIIGHFFNTGKFDLTRTIALTGSEVSNPQYYKVLPGTSMETIVNGKVKGNHVRYISGNVLTGDKKALNEYLGYYHNQVTVIPEGDQYKFFLTTGWLGLGFDKFSNSRLFPTFLMPKSKKFVLDTNTNGEERAFVVTGELDRVFPFDILPMQLVKAAITNDIDGMENLGIYEVAPEDFALCEYVCTTKIDIQDKIRQGLDVIAKECM
ncbi:MAG: Na(+)-translocating NADH-quinone reductase subunit A [Flavobacteriales bacterium]|nr:Na(+)-translocating NADH-quinone reductase subunit A [Flavobacteriales bacterium]